METRCPLCHQFMPDFKELSRKELLIRLHALVYDDVGAFRNMAYRAALLAVLDELKEREQP